MDARRSAVSPVASLTLPIAAAGCWPVMHPLFLDWQHSREATLLLILCTRRCVKATGPCHLPGISRSVLASSRTVQPTPLLTCTLPPRPSYLFTPQNLLLRSLALVPPPGSSLARLSCPAARSSATGIPMPCGAHPSSLLQPPRLARELHSWMSERARVGRAHIERVSDCCSLLQLRALAASARHAAGAAVCAQV